MRCKTLLQAQRDFDVQPREPLPPGLAGPAGLIDALWRYAAAPTLSICGRSHHRTGASLRGVFQEALEDDGSIK